MATPIFSAYPVAKDLGVRLVVEGELDLASAPDLAEALREHKEARATVVLDLSGLDFIDSTGMRVLLEAVKAAQADGWNLTVGAEFTEPVRRAFELTGLLALLPISEPR